MKRPIMRMLGALRVIHVFRLVMIHFVMVHRSMTMIANAVVIDIIYSDGMDQTGHIFTE